jgi:hypothetical protein
MNSPLSTVFISFSLVPATGKKGMMAGREKESRYATKTVHKVPISSSFFLGHLNIKTNNKKVIVAQKKERRDNRNFVRDTLI